MASNTELENRVNYAQNLVRQAEQGGLIDGATARQHLRALGAEEAAATAVTVTLQVRGDLAEARRYGGQINEQVEASLRGTAQRAGLEVVRNSVRVNF